MTKSYLFSIAPMSCKSPIKNKFLIRSLIPILSNRIKSYCLQLIESVLILVGQLEGLRVINSCIPDYCSIQHCLQYFYRGQSFIQIDIYYFLEFCASWFALYDSYENGLP
jgi:hypothetical protein